MSWYEFLLFVHVAAAAVWLGGGFIFQAYGVAVRNGADPREMATFAGRASRVGERVFVPASFLVLLAGVGMMIDGNWDWGQLWVVFALVIFAASFVSGLFHIAPMGKKIEQVGPESPEGQELIRKIFTHLRIELVFLFSIVFAMTVKPTFEDGWTVLLAAGVLAALTAAIVLRSRAAFTRGRRPERGLVGLELDEEGASGDAVALLDVHGLHGRVVGRRERRLHLHRLEHEQRPARLDAVAWRDVDADHRSRHRRRHAASRRRLRRGRARRCRRPERARAAPAGG